MLNESLAAVVVIPVKFIHALHNPCCKFVVVEPPSPVTTIDPAEVLPVSVFSKSVLILINNLQNVHKAHHCNSLPNHFLYY